MDITLFEIHLDGAQFGPATIGDEVMDRMSAGRKSGREEDEGRNATETVEGEPSGRPFGRRAARFVPVFVVLGIAGYAASRRFRGGEHGEEEAMDADAEAVEIAA